jgi:hypothetical protein
MRSVGQDRPEQFTSLFLALDLVLTAEGQVNRTIELERRGKLLMNIPPLCRCENVT